MFVPFRLAAEQAEQAEQRSAFFDIAVTFSVTFTHNKYKQHPLPIPLRVYHICQVLFCGPDLAGLILRHRYEYYGANAAFRLFAA